MQDQIGIEEGASGQEETVAALQAEVARLEQAQSIQRAADTALDSLQDKIAVLKVKQMLSKLLNACLDTYTSNLAKPVVPCLQLSSESHERQRSK